MTESNQPLIIPGIPDLSKLKTFPLPCNDPLLPDNMVSMPEDFDETSMFNGIMPQLNQVQARMPNTVQSMLSAAITMNWVYASNVYQRLLKREEALLSRLERAEQEIARLQELVEGKSGGIAS